MGVGGAVVHSLATLGKAAADARLRLLLRYSIILFRVSCVSIYY